MPNAVNWFEIPANDMDRAVKFYSQILDKILQPFAMGSGFFMAMLPYTPGVGVGGALVSGEGYQPSTLGTLVYLNGGDDLTVILDRVEVAGGQVLAPKYSIGENGFVGIFLDSEGNKVGLHSMR